MKMMKGYSRRFVEQINNTHYSMVEKALYISVVAMLVINSAFVFYGRDVGSAADIRMAKLQAEQELMALQQH